MDTPQSKAGNTASQQRPFSMDAAIAEFQVIRKEFPQYHLNDLITAVRILAQQNKAAIGGFIDPIIQQLHDQQG